jgi:hypothetical protein
MRPGEIIPVSKSDDLIGGWVSYKFHYEVLPRSSTASAGACVYTEPASRYHKNPYEGHIKTPTENALWWAFPAFAGWLVLAASAACYILTHLHH